MPQGNYDHPSYVTRQQIVLAKSTAGANGTSYFFGFPETVRIRNVSATVVTAGTSAGAGNACQLLAIGTSAPVGGTSTTTTTTTATIGSINLGTSTANVVSTSGDLNTILYQGSILAIKNGTDATGVFQPVVELHIDPYLGTWAGN